MSQSLFAVEPIADTIRLEEETKMSGQKMQPTRPHHGVSTSLVLALLLLVLSLVGCQRQTVVSEATATAVSAGIATDDDTPVTVEPTIAAGEATTTATEPTAVAAEPTLTAVEPTATEPTAGITPTVAADDADTSGINLLAVATDLDRFSTLLAALNASSLAETLQAEGPFTLFAPTNAAFAALPESALEALLGDVDTLSSLLKNHVVEGRVNMDMALAEGELQTMAGNTIMVTAGENGAILVDEFEVLRSDIEGGNGLLHAIDDLLLPPSNIEPPIIDETGVPTFDSPLLTIVGTGEPATTLVITLDGNTFGATTVEADGTWLVADRVADGEHTIVAYTLDDSNIPLARSKPVVLISPAP